MNDIKLLTFVTDGNVIFHPETNELEYHFRMIGSVMKTVMLYKIIPEKRTIESVNIYYPQIVGDPGVVQYPINMSADVILSDYDTMVKQFDLQRDDK